MYGSETPGFDREEAYLLTELRNHKLETLAKTQ